MPSLTTRFHTLSAGSEVGPLDSAVNFNATIDEFILCGGMVNIVYPSDVDVTSYLTNVSYIIKVIINDAATHTQPSLPGTVIPRLSSSLFVELIPHKML